MKIYMINPRGFCSGVKRALSVVEKAINSEKTPIYVLHEIVHNTYVIDGFKKQGVVFCESLDEIPDNSTVIFSAHGVSSFIWEEAKKKNLKILDATCPLVKKLHDEVKFYLKKDYIVFILGKKNHQEIIEVKNENPSKIFLVESQKDIDDLPLSTGKTIYFTQTTLPLYEIDNLASLLQKKYPQMEKPKIAACYATINRQQALIDILPKVEAVLVIGDEKSANSKRLKEIAEKMKKKSHLLLHPQSLEKKDFEKVTSIAITAGASTPEVLVQNILQKLQGFFPIEVENIPSDKA